MVNHLRPAIVMMALFTLLLGLAYPLAITGFAQTVFPAQADGSLVRGANGVIQGSSLIGQPFAEARYLHPRPSAAGEGYNAAGSSGSNLGPLNPDLAQRIRTDAEAIRAETGARIVPADAVTASGSGLDPDISPAYADLQAPRIAVARGLTTAQVQGVIDQHTQGVLLGFIGQPRVNVLMTNRALDTLKSGPTAKPAG